MKRFIVTVKNPAHDPRNKVTGPCPGKPCTDVTGEHHTRLVEADDSSTVEDIKKKYEIIHRRVTRVEEV